jgi:hypothetical protein
MAYLHFRNQIEDYLIHEEQFTLNLLFMSNKKRFCDMFNARQMSNDDIPSDLRDPYHLYLRIVDIRRQLMKEMDSKLGDPWMSGQNRELLPNELEWSVQEREERLAERIRKLHKEEEVWELFKQRNPDLRPTEQRVDFDGDGLRKAAPQNRTRGGLLCQPPNGSTRQ